MVAYANPATFRLLAVVVLYKLAPADSPALRSLLEAANTLQENAQSGMRFSALVWDNTPGGQPHRPPDGVRYISAPENPGLASAYNAALSLASNEGYDWLLTLDQDTVLPPGFLSRVACYATLGAAAPAAAIVPQVEGDGRVLSPYRLISGALPRWFASGFVGAQTGVYALNSGAVLRVASLCEAGGYDPAFPLDMSDIALFHRLSTAGKRVFIAGDLHVHHELSLLNKEVRMSLDRYRAGLRDETAFYDLHMSWLARLERLLRLAGRAWRDRRQPALRPFYAASLQELRRRLFVPRRRRMSDFRRLAIERSQP